MGKSPAFQFYASDFLSDENVVLMSNQEVGCYIKLLCFNWKQGSIPNDIDKLSRLCGESKEIMDAIWENIKSCFKENSSGRLVNPRIERERVKQKRFSENRKKAGKLGAEKRWKNNNIDGKAIAQPMANDDSSSSSLDIYPQDIISFVNDFIDFICNTHKNLSPDKTDSLVKNSCDSIDKLIRLDSFNLDYIRLVLGWAVKDNFWGNNILSLAGLRTKSKNGLKKFQNIAVAYENKDGEKEKPKEKVYITGELGLAN